jgi:hypothetical protein
MATIAFTKLETTVRMEVDSSLIYYKPVMMIPVVSGNNITFQHPSNINYDFTISSTDTITAGGSPVSGTAEEIADELAETIFFEAAGGGGGGADLSTENTWIADQHFNTENIDIYHDTEDVTMGATAFDNAAMAYIYATAGTNSVDVKSFGPTNASTTKNLITLTGAKSVIDVIASAADALTITVSGTNYLVADGWTTGYLKLADGKFIIDAWNAVPEYADNAAAVAASKPVGFVYRTGDVLKIVHD